MPETVAGLIRNAEIIGEADTADERHLIVNEDEFAVIAVQIGPPAPEVERVVETQLDPALAQALAVLLTQVPAARPIEQTAYPHAPGRRCGEDREDPVEALPRLHQIEFDIDGLLRLLHGLDQLRKETVAIHHEFEAVVFPPGVIGGCRHAYLGKPVIILGTADRSPNGSLRLEHSRRCAGP